jgi:hypothetical protein
MPRVTALRLLPLYPLAVGLAQVTLVHEPELPGAWIVAWWMAFWVCHLALLRSWAGNPQDATAGVTAMLAGLALPTAILQLPFTGLQAWFLQFWLVWNYEVLTFLIGAALAYAAAPNSLRSALLAALSFALGASTAFLELRPADNLPLYTISGWLLASVFGMIVVRLARTWQANAFADVSESAAN